MSLLDAMRDLKSAIVDGAGLSVADEIAADYQINPVLLVRKLCENVGATTDNVSEIVRQRASDASKQTLADAKIETVRQRAIQAEQSKKEAEVICEWFRNLSADLLRSWR